MQLSITNKEKPLCCQIKCGSCNAAYIGETKRHFQVRQYEHLGKSILTEKPLKYNNNFSSS